MNIDDYIKNRLNEQINWYDEKSQHSQKWYKRFFIFATLCTSIISVLSGIFFTFNAVNIIILILSVLSSFINLVNYTFNYQENWVKYRQTCESLKTEYYLFINKVAPYENENPEKLFIENCEGIMLIEHNTWIKQNKK